MLTSELPSCSSSYIPICPSLSQPFKQSVLVGRAISIPWIPEIPLRQLLSIAINGLLMNGREDLLPSRTTPIITCSSTHSIQLFKLLKNKKSMAKCADVVTLLKWGADNSSNQIFRKRKWNALGLALRLNRLDLFRLIYLQNTETFPVYSRTYRVNFSSSLISTGNKQLIEMVALRHPKIVGTLYVNNSAFHEFNIEELVLSLPSENACHLALALLKTIAESQQSSDQKCQSILKTVIERFPERKEIRDWWLQNRLSLIATRIHSQNWIDLTIQLDPMMTSEPLPCEVVLNNWDSLTMRRLRASNWLPYEDKRTDLLLSRVAPPERLSMIFKVLEHPHLKNNHELIRKVLGINHSSLSGSTPSPFTEAALSQQNEKGEVPYITAARSGAVAALSHLWKPHIETCQDSNGNTALMAATKRIIARKTMDSTALIEIIRLNLDNAFIIPDFEGFTPLHRSILARRADIVHLILTELRDKYPGECKIALKQKAAIPGHKSKKTALGMAKKLKFIEIVNIIQDISRLQK